MLQSGCKIIADESGGLCEPLLISSEVQKPMKNWDITRLDPVMSKLRASEESEYPKRPSVYTAPVQNRER